MSAIGRPARRAAKTTTARFSDRVLCSVVERAGIAGPLFYSSVSTSSSRLLNPHSLSYQLSSFA